MGGNTPTVLRRVQLKQAHSALVAHLDDAIGTHHGLAWATQPQLAIKMDLQGAYGKSPKVSYVDREQSPALRFSATGLAKQRQRLGLSAAACGRLLGVSALSVYKWERGKTRPRAKQLPAIAALRTMGKREANTKLQELGH